MRVRVVCVGGCACGGTESAAFHRDLGLLHEVAAHEVAALLQSQPDPSPPVRVVQQELRESCHQVIRAINTDGGLQLLHGIWPAETAQTLPAPKPPPQGTPPPQDHGHTHKHTLKERGREVSMQAVTVQFGLDTGVRHRGGHRGRQEGGCLSPPGAQPISRKLLIWIVSSSSSDDRSAHDASISSSSSAAGAGAGASSSCCFLMMTGGAENTPPQARSTSRKQP